MAKRISVARRVVDTTKKSTVDTPGNYAAQLSYDGKTERVDLSEYTCQVRCSERGCKQIRYIKPQDAFQVKRCKPHTREYQRAARAAYRRERRAAQKVEVVALSKAAAV